MQVKPKIKKAFIKKRMKKKLSSRYLIASLVLAACLWVYSNMNIEFVTFVKVPLVVKLPKTRAVENPMPPDISVEVRGSGWQLFNLMYLNSTASCTIDLSVEKLKGAEHDISQGEIIKGLQNFGNVQAIDVIPHSLNLQLGYFGEFLIPVNSRVDIIPREGFIQVGKLEIKPDLIFIRGYNRIVKDIKSWNTISLQIEDVYKPLTMIAPLSDSLNNLVELSQKAVKINADIQLAAEQTFHDVEIRIKGGNLDNGHRIVPDHLNITLRGGIEQLGKISQESIKATIDLSAINNDSTGIIIPEISVPDNIQVLSYEPRYVYHFKNVLTLKR